MSTDSNGNASLLKIHFLVFFFLLFAPAMKGCQLLAHQVKIQTTQLTISKFEWRRQLIGKAHLAKIYRLLITQFHNHTQTDWA